MRRRLSIGLVLCALVAGAAVSGVSRGAGGATALPACVSGVLVPQLGAVTINQGVGSYARLARGKETLVRYFLTLPSSVGTSCSGSITVKAAQLTVGSGPTALAPILAFQSFGTSGTAIAASTPSVDSNADPKFVVPGKNVNSCLVDLTATGCDDASPFSLTFSAAVTYTTSASTTPVTATFSSFNGNPITGAVEKATNALRILVVPMGDAGLTRASQFGAAAQTALVNGFNTLSRVYPVRFGISNDLGVATGGIRYTIDPGLLNLRALTGTYDPNGKFCGTSSNFNAIKGQLDTFLATYNSNAANASHPADKVLGVVDSAISDGNTSAYNCAEGMAATANTSNTAIPATEAWVRAIPDVAATKSVPAQPSMTGALMAMEIAHTFAQEKQVTGNTTFHSLNTAADVTAPDRAYNVSNRSFLPDDHTAMRFVTPWNNNNTDFEPSDFSSMLCNLGGASFPADCTSPAIGGVPAATANQFMIAGTTDFTPGGTHVVESFTASLPAGSAISPVDPSSDLKVKFTPFTGSGDPVTIGIPYSDHNSVHDANAPGRVDIGAAVFGGIFDAPQGISKVELFKGSTLLYTRNAQPDPPEITTDGFAPGDSTSSSVTYVTPVIPPRPDVLFLADNTSSMGGALTSVKNNATPLMNTIAGSPNTDAAFGAAHYRDLADEGFAAYGIDSAPMTATIATVQAGIETWSPTGGGDIPEDQLNALYRIATEPASIGWRDGSTRIITWFGDADGHPVSGGHSLADVIAALVAAGIRVVAVPVGEGLNASNQATDIAAATGGTVTTAATPADVAPAILAGLSNLSATVTPSPNCDDGLSMLFDGNSASDASKTVTSGASVSWNETIKVGLGAVAGTTLHCTVQFDVNGTLAEGFSQSISIKIRSGNQVGFTATASDPSTLVGHVNYDCGNGEQIPLAVGLKPTSVVGDVATFAYTYEPSPICPIISGPLHDPTLTPVVSNGVQTSDLSFTTHVPTVHHLPVAAIYTPFDANAATTSPFPLSGLVTDADDGILNASWAITGPASASATGDRADVPPPSGGWPPGDYTVTLTGTDTEGHTATATRHVSVVKYQFNGFLSPVDNPPIVNSGNAGRTYPVKFSLAALPSLTPVTDTSVVTASRYSATGCGAGLTDALETVATGSTSLRNVGGQYIYNWATPSKAGCYTLSITLDDGTTHVALFNLK